MLSRVLSFAIGVLGLVVMALNLLFIPTFILIVALFRFVIPLAWWRRVCTRFLHALPRWWIDINAGVLKWGGRHIQWELPDKDVRLRLQGQYFLICNHRSWTDILILQHVFNRQIPLLSFFLKKQLLWSLPIAGLACWALGFPVMERYSKGYLKKNPHKKGKDFETTKKACEHFKDKPITLVSFVEGTRFTPEKCESQGTPFRHLLRPKAGGFAYALGAMDGRITQLVNVTLCYQGADPSLWNILTGRLQKISLQYQVQEIPTALIGSYQADKQHRREFQAWLNELWQAKDHDIEQLSQLSSEQEPT